MNELSVSYRINPKIVRGLDYYTQTAFEFVDANLGAQSTLIGGGRYNKLVQELGGKDVSGIGFAGGFERLLLSMQAESVDQEDTYNLDAYIVYVGEEAEKKAYKLVHLLRKNSISTDFTLEKKSLRAQMKATDKAKAKFAILIGEKELSENFYTVRRMETGEQEEVREDNLLSYMKKIANKF